jgi:hypothetical protein
MRSARSSLSHGLLRAGVVALAALAFTAAPAGADVAFGTGVSQVDGERVLVEVFVAVPGTRSAQPLVERALAQQNAVAVAEAHYAFSGLKWNLLPVVQFYNPEREVVGAHEALIAAGDTWSGVAGSAFRMAPATTTDRCPSLTRGCGTDQFFDDHSDVGWQRLARGTLGVTWYSTLKQEADVALTTRYPWTTGCDLAATGAYDVETVLLHENGHVAGLDHSSDPAAVMYASYQGARCLLAGDDEDGIRALYPSG